MKNKYINPSGFTENLPNEQIVEDRLKKIIAEKAESFGYVHLETSSVEYMDTLVTNGEVTKEIFSIGRAQAEGENDEAERGLHFDLTVPFARYVAQNQGALTFPFRRYQIQKVWRGERPQKGRFREFYQADIDVVAQETLSPAFDAEVAKVMANTLNSFNIGKITIRVNNRKFLNGLLESIGIEMTDRVLQTIDKVDKIGRDGVSDILCNELQYSQETVDTLFSRLDNPINASDVENYLAEITSSNPNLDEGKTELKELFTSLSKINLENVNFVLDPKIARGLDYYTGNVFETTIDGFEKYGSICSGGRYANLASRFTNRNLPGVGLSIGLTRLLSILKEENLTDFSVKTNSQVVVCLLDNEQKDFSESAADYLREAGLNVETNQKASTPLGRQLDIAQEKGIPFALVCEKDRTFTLYEIQNQNKQTFDSLEGLAEKIKTG